MAITYNYNRHKLKTASHLEQARNGNGNSLLKPQKETPLDPEAV
jgi:hypothetical protein